MQNLIITPVPYATFITQDESSSLYCDGSIKASLTGGTGTILPTWNTTPVQTTDSIGALCPGNYILTLVDSNGCTNTYTETIQAGPIPPTPPICLVTVDSTFTHNLVVWEKTSLDMIPIDSFLVYREIGTNSYHQIGAVSHDSMSTFDDFGANPATTGYRYKLKSKNAHGVLSVFSDYHNTIYLTNTGGNFNWTPYQVENITTPVFTYNVYRDDNSTGNFQLIGNTTGNQFGYTDLQFSSFPNASYYVEAVMSSGACNPTRSSIPAARSNVKHFGTTGFEQLVNNAAINIFPNPSTGKFSIQSNSGNIGMIEIYNVLGEQIYLSELKNKTSNEIDLSGVPKGIYFVKISDDNKGVINKKIVIQ
jgi:hypothetical protein